MKRLLSVLILLVLAGSATAVLPTRDEPVRTVILIRHGEYEHGVDTPDEGGLVALGRQQARLTAERLDALPLTLDSLHSSTMTRARETAEIVAAHFPGLEIVFHDDIRECTPATLREDIMLELEPGEAELCEAGLERAWPLIFRPADADRDQLDVVICHGNVIRWYVCKVLGVDPIHWLGMSIANCSLTTVQIRPDGSTKLLGFADSGHIPYGMTTYPGTEAPQ